MELESMDVGARGKFAEGMTLAGEGVESQLGIHISRPSWTMPQDGPHDVKQPARRAPEPKSRSDWRDKFGIPEPVKRVFRKFPLTTYPANDLPITSPSQRDEHSLWLWTTREGASNGAPSFNPSCLKWQTYLKFSGLPFRTIASNNHASPSGILPFLLPAAASAADLSPSSAPIASNKLRTWAQEHGASIKDDASPSRAEAYTALLDHRLRQAWLYTLYLEPDNFEAVAKRLYVTPSSSNLFVNTAISYQLRKAAADELSKTNAHVSAEELIEEAKEAFAALATLLKGDSWFFGEENPGLFDASVFAYTHLLLDENMGWKRNELSDALRSHPTLVEHRERILRQYFPS